jgi:hypothetical protein
MATKQAGIILHHLRKMRTEQEAEQLSDRELLLRFARQRDEAAFATLVRRHGGMILYACQRVLHNWHDAEDAFQATFLILARKAGSRTWNESVGSWLYLVAHRLALKIRASRDRPLPRNTHAVERASDDPAGRADCVGKGGAGGAGFVAGGCAGGRDAEGHVDCQGEGRTDGGPGGGNRLESRTRDARLNALRVLVVLQGDASKNVADTVQQLLDVDEQREILGYLPLVLSPEEIQSDTATIAQRGWQRPQRGEIVLLAMDGDGRRVSSQRLAIDDVDAAVQLAKAFVKQHAPPVRDARALLTQAQSEAKKTGRRVWIVFGGPRCRPCLRLARWMEDQHALLVKDYVILKLLQGLDQGAWEVRKEWERSEYGGIPWMAITEPDGTLLVTSDGPLGNTGFPTELEDVHHLSDMLQRTAQRLTADERERIVRSLSKLEE